MRSLFDADGRAALSARLADLEPDSPRQWGRMSPNQAVCHLADGFRAALGDRPCEPYPMASVLRGAMRVFALHTPIRWPRNTKTLPEFDQRRGGTPPTSFEQDMAELRKLIDRFASTDGSGLTPHALFGDLTPREWGVWGWRHVDHHLRQFGA